MSEKRPWYIEAPIVWCYLMCVSSQREMYGARAGAIVAAWLVLCLSGCSSSSSGGSPASPGPGSNRAPVIASVFVSPSGTGLQSATLFAFSGQGISDPDGDALTYSWTSTDGAAIASTTPTASRVFPRSGSFDMRLTVTDSKGLAASAATTVAVGNLTGTWDVTCDNHPAGFPSQFVVSMTQNGATLSGNITGGGLSQDFPAPVTVSTADGVSDPKKAVFGVEASFNVWASRDGDFYFHLTADDALNSMSGSSQYCGSASARRR